MPEPDAILTEIRENHSYARDYWKSIYEEGATDIRYLTEGPWTEQERKDREGRVTLWLDELSQYTNQTKNEFRQSKRAVKLTPKGNGADDAKATKRGAMIREVEYDSNAQHAYITCGESMVDRSFGYFKLGTDWVPGRMLRRMVVSPIQNPEVILLDPDFKKPDASDCMFAFEIEEAMRANEFVRRFGKKATITSFDSASCEASKGWISASDHGYKVRLASYWKRVVDIERTIYLLQNGQEVKSDEVQGLELLKQGKQRLLAIPGVGQVPIVDSREDNEYRVRQYITNGLEILEENETDWDEVPIIPMFGPMVWVPEGGVSKLKIFSAVRRARDAEKGFCYARSEMVSKIAQDVRAPYEGWEGQFSTATDWPSVIKGQVPYVEFKLVEGINGDLVHSRPTRNLSEPQITQHEVLAEALRRSIQAGMGGSPLPTSAQRLNNKSGIALQTMEQSSDQGNYHFIDNYNRAIERAGRMMNKALPRVYDTPREHGFRAEDDEYSVEPINQVDESGQPVGFHTSDGDFGETISTGPSFQSQRDEATDFTNNLIAHPEVLGPNANQVLALLVKLRNLGPIGDQIAEILAPQDAGELPPQVTAQLQMAQQQVGEMQAELADLKTKATIEKYKSDQDADLKKYSVDEQEKTKRVLGLAQLDWQEAEARLEGMLGELKQRFDGLQADAQRQHEAGMRAGEMQHEAGMMERGHEQSREMADIGHQQAAEMADMGHRQSLEQQEKAAALQPQEPAE